MNRVGREGPKREVGTTIESSWLAHLLSSHVRWMSGSKGDGGSDLFIVRRLQGICAADIRGEGKVSVRVPRM